VGLNSLKSLNLTNVYPNNNKKNKNKNNKVKSKPLEFYELAGKKTIHFHYIFLNLKIIRQSSICAKVVYRFQEKNPTAHALLKNSAFYASLWVFFLLK
jgi:hypothetical protein